LAPDTSAAATPAAGEAARVDLIVTGRVVTMDARRTVLPDGAVAIRDGDIAAVGERAEVLARLRPARVIDRPGAIVIPGLIDCHTHVLQALVRGLVAGELPMIFRLYVPAVAALTPAEAHTAATLCAAQLLSSGVTTVCEGAGASSPEQLAAVLEAVGAVGIRCNVVRGAPDQDFHHAALYTQVRERSWRRVREGEAERDLAVTEEFLRRFPPKGRGRITGGVCASGLTSYSPRYFELARALAARHAAKVHVHAARDREEVEFCLAVAGRRPIEWLADLGMLGPDLVIAHAMLATEGEIRAIGETRTGVAHSAVEVVNILNAVPNVAMMRALGATVGLGCDNAVNDMFIAMHSAWVLHAATRGMAGYDPEILDAEATFAMATIEGARLLGLDHVVGSLEPGKAADLVVLDGESLFLHPSQDLLSELVRYGSRADVRLVLVAGKTVVEDGIVTTIDRPRLAVDAKRAAHRLREIVEPRRYRPLDGRS
jgi:5-methylthioadenosine/S-adenosylhomocysteine deaminase